MTSKELIPILEGFIQLLREHEDLDLGIFIKKLNIAKPRIKSKSSKKEVTIEKRIDDFDTLTIELKSIDKKIAISSLEEFGRSDLIKYGQSLGIKFGAKDKKDLVIIKITDYFGIANLDAKMSERSKNSSKNTGFQTLPFDESNK